MGNRCGTRKISFYCFKVGRTLPLVKGGPSAELVKKPHASMAGFIESGAQPSDDDRPGHAHGHARFPPRRRCALP